MSETTRLPGPVADLWDWQLEGSCRRVGPDVFFHPEGERGTKRRIRAGAAKEVCFDCPVIEACRSHALGGPDRTNIFSVPAVGGGDGGAMVTAADVARFLDAVRRGGVWRGVTAADVLTPRADMWDGYQSAYGVVLRPDGVFGKAGGDPGVAAIGRCRPSDGTTAVMLANVGWEDVPGLGDLVDAMDAAAFGS